MSAYNEDGETSGEAESKVTRKDYKGPVVCVIRPRKYGQCIKPKCESLCLPGKLVCGRHLCRNRQCMAITGYRYKHWVFCGKCVVPRCKAEGCTNSVANDIEKNWKYCYDHQLLARIRIEMLRMKKATAAEKSVKANINISEASSGGVDKVDSNDVDELTVYYLLLPFRSPLHLPQFKLKPA